MSSMHKILNASLIIVITTLMSFFSVHAEKLSSMVEGVLANHEDIINYLINSRL